MKTNSRRHKKGKLVLLSREGSHLAVLASLSSQLLQLGSLHMGGIGGGGGGGSLQQQGLALSLYAVLNLFLNFFNKWALGSSGAGFSFPVFYSMFHMLMSLVGSLVLMKVRPPPTGMPSLQQFGVYKWEALTAYGQSRVLARP